MKRDEEIRIIAYSLWAKEGYPRSRALDNWLRAETIWEKNRKTRGISVPTVTKYRELAQIK